MSDYRHEIWALIDRGQTERLTDGSLVQHVSVVMSDAPADPFDPTTGRRPPVLCTLRPSEARELACELLALAEQAERIGAWR